MPRASGFEGMDILMGHNDDFWMHMVHVLPNRSPQKAETQSVTGSNEMQFLIVMCDEVYWTNGFLNLFLKN